VGVRLHSVRVGALRRLTYLRRLLYRYALSIEVLMQLEVAPDIGKCAVRDVDVYIRRWPGAGMHHDCTSDRASAMRPAGYVVVPDTAIQSGSPKPRIPNNHTSPSPLGTSCSAMEYATRHPFPSPIFPRCCLVRKRRFATRFATDVAPLPPLADAVTQGQSCQVSDAHKPGQTTISMCFSCKRKERM